MARPPRVPAYSLHKPSGLAVVKVKGRSIYLGRHESSESKEAYARVVADVLAGREPKHPIQAAHPDPTRVSVGELAARYIDYARRYYRKGGKPTTEAGLVADALAFVTARYDGLPAAEFDVLGLRVVRDAMVAAGYTRNSVNKSVSRVVRCFRWGVTEKLYPGAALQRFRDCCSATGSFEVDHLPTRRMRHGSDLEGPAGAGGRGV